MLVLDLSRAHDVEISNSSCLVHLCHELLEPFDGYALTRGEASRQALECDADVVDVHDVVRAELADEHAAVDVVLDETLLGKPPECLPDGLRLTPSSAASRASTSCSPGWNRPPTTELRMAR